MACRDFSGAWPRASSTKKMSFVGRTSWPISFGVAATKYGFDPQSLIAVGYSNGANVAAAVLLLRPGMMTSRHPLPRDGAVDADRPAGSDGTRVLICSGKHDPIVPVENVERLAAMLRQAGADVTQRFEDAGHQLVFAEIAAAKKWLHES